MNLESRVRFPWVPFYFCFHFVEVFHWLSKFTDPQTQFLFPNVLSCFFFLLLLHFFEINFCSPWFTTIIVGLATGNIILRTVGSVHVRLCIGFWSVHRIEIQCCRPTNWPVYRLDQGPKLCNCSPTRGLHARGGGYLVERWVRGCAAQIGCFFGLSGFAMAPFLFENWFLYRSHFCKMHNFRWICPLVYQQVVKKYLHPNLHCKKHWLVLKRALKETNGFDKGSKFASSLVLL